MIVVLVAIVCAWWVDRKAYQKQLSEAHREASILAEELYRLRIERRYEQPYGSFFPQGTKALNLGTGPVLDLSDSGERQEAMVRLRDDDTEFRVKNSQGKVHDLMSLRGPVEASVVSKQP